MARSIRKSMLNEGGAMRSHNFFVECTVRLKQEHTF